MWTLCKRFHTLTFHSFSDLWAMCKTFQFSFFPVCEHCSKYFIFRFFYILWFSPLQVCEPYAKSFIPWNLNFHFFILVNHVQNVSILTFWSMWTLFKQFHNLIFQLFTILGPWTLCKRFYPLIFQVGPFIRFVNLVKKVS